MQKIKAHVAVEYDFEEAMTKLSHPYMFSQICVNVHVSDVFALIIAKFDFDLKSALTCVHQLDEIAAFIRRVQTFHRTQPEAEKYKILQYFFSQLNSSSQQEILRSIYTRSMLGVKVTCSVGLIEKLAAAMEKDVINESLLIDIKNSQGRMATIEARAASVLRVLNSFDIQKQIKLLEEACKSK